jgi:GH15 family glucan-1,4-alpha-glucosidase
LGDLERPLHLSRTLPRRGPSQRAVSETSDLFTDWSDNCGTDTGIARGCSWQPQLRLSLFVAQRRELYGDVFRQPGYIREATEYLRFLRNADQTGGKDLNLLYAIEGPVPPEQELSHLKGWRSVQPIFTGNAARDQQQFDIYGEYLIALHFWLDALDYNLGAFAGFDLPELVTSLANAALVHRGDPDNGIWELRSGKQQNLHTKALIFLALDRAATIGRNLGGIALDDIDRWEFSSKIIRREYLECAWSEPHKCYMQSYDCKTFDAAVMRVALFGAIDPKSEKMRSTIAALTKELGSGDLMFRYGMDDGMSGQEATFAACAFWRVGCLALSGDFDQAREIFERLLGRANDVGLFAEQIDAPTGEHRGNFPQAFTHMAVINHALRLIRS